MLSWHIWYRPLIFYQSQLRHEHVSKCLSSFLLIWIYLFGWWRDCWCNCLQWARRSRSSGEDNDEDDQQAWPPQTGRMAGFMARCAHPRHKTHFLWEDHSACPCFIDLSPLKFTTSAILTRCLTGRRFSAGMRSDGGKNGEEGGLAVGSLRRSQNGFGEKRKKGEIKAGLQRSEMEWERGRRRAALPLGGYGSRCDQRRLMVARQRPVELAPGTVEVNW